MIYFRFKSMKLLFLNVRFATLYEIAIIILIKLVSKLETDYILLETQLSAQTALLYPLGLQHAPYFIMFQ